MKTFLLCRISDTDLRSCEKMEIRTWPHSKCGDHERVQGNLPWCRWTRYGFSCLQV